ncbi:MAG: FMN-binding protein [Planctomycetes bacterium]|nr:FMN-binding protein [Planctomycetota bacterium]
MAMRVYVWVLSVVLLGLSLSAFAGSCAEKTMELPLKRTREQLDAFIEKEGTTPPEWWSDVKLNYPPDLDLTWGMNRGADVNKNLGMYIWNVINVNPSRWKEGARLLHHALTVNKDDPAKLKMTMDALAKIYHDLLQDYARAAYWWRKAGSTGSGNCPLGLADCYRILGSKELAVDVLEKYKQPMQFATIRSWAEVGEHEKALNMALDMAKSNPALKGWSLMLAGDVCRIGARYKDAIDYYQKALDCGNNPRAMTALEAVKCSEGLDLNKIPDGTYQDGSQGYSSIVQVALTVKDHKIDDVKIVAHHEKQYYGSLTVMPQRVIEKQGVKGVDVFSSATLTSEAIIRASAKALSSAMK